MKGVVPRVTSRAPMRDRNPQGQAHWLEVVDVKPGSLPNFNR